jgi:hypothetical protein
MEEGCGWRIAERKVGEGGGRVRGEAERKKGLRARDRRKAARGRGRAATLGGSGAQSCGEGARWRRRRRLRSMADGRGCESLG